VFGEVGVAVIGATGSARADDGGEPFGVAEESGAALGCDVAAVEVGADLTGTEPGKVEVG
jgi:hypothetical protein